MEFPLQASGLSKDFGHRVVLRGIDFRLAAGELVGLMGANGAGKTTLLGCLAATVRPTAGVVHWFGRPAMGPPARRRLLGMVSHESQLYPQLSLQENLVFAARIYGMDQPVQIAQRYLSEVGLRSHANRLPSQVSRGMRQRVAVSRALLHEPPILLLDEPFSGLDQESADWLTGVLCRLRDAGRAICFVTHDASKLSRLTDKIWWLGNSTLTARPLGDECAGWTERQPGRAA